MNTPQKFATLFVALVVIGAFWDDAVNALGNAYLILVAVVLVLMIGSGMLETRRETLGESSPEAKMVERERIRNNILKEHRADACDQLFRQNLSTFFDAPVDFRVSACAWFLKDEYPEQFSGCDPVVFFLLEQQLEKEARRRAQSGEPDIPIIGAALIEVVEMGRRFKQQAEEARRRERSE
jgi:hypothetical protein